jgi:hypothetical protein
MGPFEDFGITMNKNTHRKYPNNKDGIVHSGRFIFGVDVNNSTVVNAAVGADDDDDIL